MIHKSPVICQMRLDHILPLLQNVFLLLVIGVQHAVCIVCALSPSQLFCHQLVEIFICWLFSFARRQKAYIRVIERCYSKLGLESLKRDASVSDVQMESCCQRLLRLHEMSVLKSDLTSCRLKVAQFYSVMSDGDICVPWNFEDVA